MCLPVSIPLNNFPPGAHGLLNFPSSYTILKLSSTSLIIVLFSCVRFFVSPLCMFLQSPVASLYVFSSSFLILFSLFHFFNALTCSGSFLLELALFSLPQSVAWFLSYLFANSLLCFLFWNCWPFWFTYPCFMTLLC